MKANSNNISPIKSNFGKLPSTVIVAVGLLLSVFYSFYVERWNAAHDGIVDLFIIVFAASVVVMLSLLIFNKGLRANKLFIITAASVLLMFIYIIVITYLFSCPYCHDFSLAKR